MMDKGRRKTFRTEKASERERERERAGRRKKAKEKFCVRIQKESIWHNFLCLYD